MYSTSPSLTRAPLFLLLIIFLIAPASKALSQSRVWISNPTGFQITYKLLFARSAQNFTIPAGRRNEHSTREYPPTFLVDLNVVVRGYPQIKRFRLIPNQSYYFTINGNQLMLQQQPLHQQTQLQAPVTAKVLVYALGGPRPVYHSSIILYNTSDPRINGREWSFFPYGRANWSNIGYIASGRVNVGKPTGAGQPIRVFDLTTRQTPQMAANTFNNVVARWNRMPYRALDSNCNHFVNDVMNSLGAGRHPVQYQNSWGGQIPPAHVQSTLQQHYGVQCNNPAHHHHNHGHQNPLPHGPNVHQPLDPKAEILRRILRRIGL